MGKRRENMLEAFKASHDQTVRNRQVAEAVEAARLVRSGGPATELHGATEPGLPSVTSGGPSRGRGADAELHDPPEVALQRHAPESNPGPVRPVGEQGASPTMRKPGPYADTQQAVSGLILPMGWAPFLLLQAMILAVAFGLGWIASGAKSGGEGALATGGELVLDSPDSGPGSEGAANAGLNSPLRGGRAPTVLGNVDPSDGGQAPDAGAKFDSASRSADLAFDDPASRFTVVVAQYNDTTYGRARAWAAFEFLDSQGLPVVSPRARNRVVFLFAGATVERDKLDLLLEKVRSQAGESGRDTPFYDAYVSNISRYL